MEKFKAFVAVLLGIMFVTSIITIILCLYLLAFFALGLILTFVVLKFGVLGVLGFIILCVSVMVTREIMKDDGKNINLILKMKE